MTDVENFCVVWNPEGKHPFYRHPNVLDAKAEAMRLAAKQPGQRFYVLQCRGFAIVQEPVIWKDAEEPLSEEDLPF